MIKREFKINLKSLIIWSSITVLLLLMGYVIYPFIEVDSSFKNMLDMFPKDVLKAFNMDIFSIDTVYGWIKTEGYAFVLLLGAFYSSILGSNILSIEEKDKTIEFLSSKPITRNYIVRNKIICGILYILVFTIIVFLTNLIGLSFSKQLVIKELLLISFAPLMIYYFLFFVSLLLTTMKKRIKKNSYVGLIVTTVFYILFIAGTISSKVEILSKISIFEASNIRYIIDHMSINYIYLAVSVFVSIICIILTHIVYNKKELM